MRKIKKVYAKSKDEETTDESVLKWAQSYVDLHQESTIDYSAKYEKYIVNKNADPMDVKAEQAIDVPIEETGLYQELKKYRLEKSREEKIKPYFIYNNKEFEAFINVSPCIEYMIKGFIIVIAVAIDTREYLEKRGNNFLNKAYAIVGYLKRGVCNDDK